MAVFMINECKFGGCSRTYPTLGDLIRHIEANHLDWDPGMLEEKESSQPPCLHMSYVLKFDNETSDQDYLSSNFDVRKKTVPFISPTSIRSVTPTGSEFDDEDIFSVNSDNSNTSWATAEEFSADFIINHSTRMNTSGIVNEKPFACPVPGCEKRYKNMNGIKYHAKNGHKKEGRIKKPHRCPCGKSYKTSQNLKTHIASHSGRIQSPIPSSHTPLSPTPSLTHSHQIKPVSLPVMKALQGFVGSPHNHLSTNYSNNRIKTMSQIQNVPEIENTKTIRAILENSRRSSKDNIRAVMSSTLPKQNFNYNHANIVNRTSTPVSHHAKYETDVSNYVETKPSHRMSSQYLIENDVSSPNSLGILTPASSPNSMTCEKIICLSEDEKSSVYEHKSNIAAMSPLVNIPSLPLTPVTPKHDSHITYPVMDN